MAKTLVIAEKPSVGKELARVLGCKKTREGYKEGEGYIVTWSFGHLVTLADPESYQKEYKVWRLDALPMLPDKMKLVVIKQTAKQFAVVKQLIRSEDVNEVVIATDAGREGELVARWILEKAGCKKEIKRLWISSQTDQAIRDGFAQLRPGREYEPLYRSAKARAEADWLIGLNVTRALTCKFHAQLSAGRVQTPTLAMIVKREEEIQRFQPKDFYSVVVKSGSVLLTRRDRKTKNVRFSDQQLAQEIVQKVDGKPGQVMAVKRKQKKEAPPLLYDLTELQRDANKRYGYSAKQTLSIMQRLYENHKLLTYPRTDSRYLSSDIVPTLPERLRSIAGYFPEAKECLKRGITPTKRFVDDTKVSDHHAIIPTEQFLDLSVLTNEERHIYQLVVYRFLAALSPDFVYEQTTIEVDIAGEWFTAQGKIVTQYGWKRLGESTEEEEDREEPEQSLPDIQDGDWLSEGKAEWKTGKTTPPPRYTEGTLLTAMEFAGRQVEDETMREALNSANGLGTPATRADIIEKLFHTGYIESRGKELHPTSKGIQLIELVPEDLKSPLLTGNWEQTLSAISKGEVDDKAFLRDMRQYATDLVGEIAKSGASYRPDNRTKNKCPDCGQFLLEVRGKKGKSYVCENPDCRYREQVSTQTNARCPNCHKRLELRGSGENRIYVCPCGYREKGDAFQKRMAQNKTAMSKREVSSYLRQQQEEATFNTAMADALKKLGL